MNCHLRYEEIMLLSHPNFGIELLGDIEVEVDGELMIHELVFISTFSTDPTQKMPRALSTSASLFRSLLHKTELMGLSTESQPLHSTSVGDIRKKWHIPPAFK